jgi:hypothetical protein
MKSNKQQRLRRQHLVVADIREVDTPVAGILVGATADRVVKADPVAVTVDRVAMRDPAVLAADPEDHAAASGNISGRRKFASSASRRWT